jgi:hypothetical protein
MSREALTPISWARPTIRYMRTSTPPLPVFTRIDRDELQELRHRDRFLWLDPVGA